VKRTASNAERSLTIEQIDDQLIKHEGPNRWHVEAARELRRLRRAKLAAAKSGEVRSLKRQERVAAIAARAQALGDLPGRIDIIAREFGVSRSTVERALRATVIRQ
jgi:DNA invertase Pin-like site-specific DNA recombinase